MLPSQFSPIKIVDSTLIEQTLFISDLHLSLDKPEITQRFIYFLKTRAPKSQAVYILGDLFDAWVGDDDFTPPNKAIRLQLKQLTDSGVKVYFQSGNRDFLIGDRFCQETGIILLGDYHCIVLYGIPTLLTHGDLLCSDDIAYQEFRKKSRHSDWRNNVLSKPLFLRLLMARWYRLRSHFHKRKKSSAIMDVNQSTVLSTMQRFQVERLIHGHTHRPAVHNFTLNHQSAQRFVLADWKKHSASTLCWSKTGYNIEIME
jgi:UDP-2,3-diacylglucosamine hydrolase